MYALNYPLKGLVEGSESLNGLNGADYECYRQSKEAGLNGTFRAFLSSRVQDVKSIVREEDRMLPIMNYNVSCKICVETCKKYVYHQYCRI